MIAPQHYDEWPDGVAALAQRLEENILGDICRRLAKDGRITSTAYKQTHVLINYSGLSYDEISKRIAEITKLTADEIDEIYQMAVDEICEDERYTYEYFQKPAPTRDNPRVQSFLNAAAEQTKAEFKNLTASLGFMVYKEGALSLLPIGEAYQDCLDFATLQIQSGGSDPNTAIKKAVTRLADSGLRTVDYASGHRDHIDVATRRAVVTGMHQISDRMVDAQIEELGGNFVEVSAHSHARDKGTGFQNHKSWQGRVYWLKTPAEGYKPFVETTGYGDVQGFGGANCRHDKHLFIPGVTQRMYTDEQLANIDPPPFDYQGKEYTASEARDKQREIERTMRKYKRRLNALRDAGADETDYEYQKAAGRLAAWSREYKDFSKAAGLRVQPERAQLLGFDRVASRQAQKAVRMADGYGALEGTQASGGIAVQKVSLHFGQRAVSRNITQENVRNALMNPLYIGSIRADGTKQYIGREATVAIDPATGTITTVWATSSSRVRKYGGKNDR